MLRPWELQIAVDLSNQKAVYIQIADAIIDAIKNQTLQSGDALPGSRKLAEKIKVNRNTVIKALDILLAEGWLETKERKGVFVAELKNKYKHGKLQVNQLGSVENNVPQREKPRIIFSDGHPDSRLAPTKELAMAYRQIFNRKAKWQMMGYSHAKGDIHFRNAIVKMLNHKRGMGLTVDHLCLTRGSQMALYLAAQCLLEKDDAVIIENPGYQPAWLAFQKTGAKLLPVSVEKDGLNLEEVKNYIKSGKKIKALYTTPHHQFPTTVSLSLQKRLELIDLSNTHGFTIIEDDYDHEFHFSARPLLPIGSLATIKNYVYIGTFSKIVSPALRLGYIASHGDFIDQVASLRAIIDVQGDNIMEQAVLELINDGSIRKHLKRAALIYHKKRDYFDGLLQKHLREKVNYFLPDGGLAFWLVPKKEMNITQFTERMLEKGIQILKPAHYCFNSPAAGMRLGYASLTEEQLEEGIIQLAKQM